MWRFAGEGAGLASEASPAGVLGAEAGAGADGEQETVACLREGATRVAQAGLAHEAGEAGEVVDHEYARPAGERGLAVADGVARGAGGEGELGSDGLGVLLSREGYDERVAGGEGVYVRGVEPGELDGLLHVAEPLVDGAGGGHVVEHGPEGCALFSVREADEANFVRSLADVPPPSGAGLLGIQVDG